MNIAVVGWGSLIWCPGNLRIKTRWRSDGPALPIEFARISSDHRVTLVIHPGLPDQPAYWALSAFTTLKEARDNLRAREGANSADIHYADFIGNAAPGAPPEIATRITDWLALHRPLEAVIWTGLPGNWGKKAGRDFTPEAAVQYLLGLEAKRDQDPATYRRAREYVTNAPPLIDTDVRRTMRKHGWTDNELPQILFET